MFDHNLDGTKIGFFFVQAAKLLRCPSLGKTINQRFNRSIRAMLRGPHSRWHQHTNQQYECPDCFHCFVYLCVSRSAYERDLLIPVRITRHRYLQPYATTVAVSMDCGCWIIERGFFYGLAYPPLFEWIHIPSSSLRTPQPILCRCISNDPSSSLSRANDEFP